MIPINNPPPISGLYFRHFQGESDYSKIAAVLIDSEKADQIERKVTAKDIANAYQDLKNCDPYQDIVIAEVSGEMIGYVRGWWRDESESVRLYEHNGFIIPEWRRKGIGWAMLIWIENRLLDISATHVPEMTKFFQVNISQFQNGTAIMLEHTGYYSVRYFYEMVRPTLDDIPTFPLPEGLVIRPVLPEQYHAIWLSIDETSRDEWGYKQPTDDDYHEWLTSPHFQPHLWKIAWNKATNQVIGHVLTYIDFNENKQFGRKRGYTEGIGVDKAWRRLGIARALINQSLLAQKEAGMTESALVADSESMSGVTRLYENCGFQITKYSSIYRKPLVLELKKGSAC